MDGCSHAHPEQISAKNMGNQVNFRKKEVSFCQNASPLLLWCLFYRLICEIHTEAQ